MSRASKLTLLGTTAFAAGTVFFVHWQQQSEKMVSLRRTAPSHAKGYGRQANSPDPRRCTKA